jgi:L-lactate dehydrogenase
MANHMLNYNANLNANPISQARRRQQSIRTGSFSHASSVVDGRSAARQRVGARHVGLARAACRLLGSSNARGGALMRAAVRASVNASADPGSTGGGFDLFRPVPGSDSRTLSSSSGSSGSGSSSPFRTSKLSVVGVGNVGMACAQTCLTEDLVDELALVDVQADKLRGEMLDLQHAAAFLPRVRIVAGTDYAVTAGSDVCVVTAGARQRDGESRLALLGRNVSLLRGIIPELIRHSPETILLIVSNPVDILTYVSWKLARGALPPNRVIGTGTNLDSSRLRFLIADKFGVNAHNIHGYLVGEHGDSSVPLWSSVSIANVPILELPDPDASADADGRKAKYTKESLRGFHDAVVGSAYEVIKLKGYTSWAIGYSVASLVKCILRDQRRIYPVSVLANGFYGIDRDVYLSLPSQLGRAGVLGVANLSLDDDELLQLRRSASTLWDMQSGLEL